jgi:ribose transport system substrate-binding protein
VITAIPLFAIANPSSCEHVGMEEALSKTGLRLNWNGPSDGDAQRQIDLLDAAVKEKSYGIAIDPRSLYAANGVIRDAISHDIPVVVMLHPLPIAPRAHLSFVVEDVHEGAALIVKRLVQSIGGNGDIILIGLDSLTPGGEDRFEAVEDALREFAPDLRIVKRISGPPEVSYFSLAIEQALEDNPHVRAVLALDGHSANASASAVYRMHAEGRVTIEAFDQVWEALTALRHGTVDAVLAPDLRQIGRIAIQNLLTDHLHKPVPSYTYVEPILITRENIDDEKVQQALLMNWDHP